MSKLRPWIPAIILVAGCALNGLLTTRRAGATPLRTPISTIAPALLGTTGVVDTVDAEQRRVAGMSEYVLRHYAPTEYAPFSVYVGYYDEQHQGKSIHSPKNCLPGAGWEPVETGAITIPTPSGAVTVNRYLIASNQARAIVYYWYQGRGRVAHDEMRVKFELLRDAVLRGRTEEALVRIVVELKDGDTTGADRIAQEIVPTLVRDVGAVVPVF